MSKKEKLLTKLFDKKNDFTWDELATLLSKLGYSKVEGSGSRVKFYNRELNHFLSFHKPHPHPTIRGYAIDYAIKELESRGIRP